MRLGVSWVSSTGLTSLSSFTGPSCRPERLVPTNESFRTIAQQVTHGKTTDFARARALYDHVIDKLPYAKYGSGWGRGDAVYAL